MTDDEYRNTPEYRKWEEETARRSEAMTDAVHDIQGNQLVERDDNEARGDDSSTS
jgi:hypothetical protein